MTRLITGTPFLLAYYKRFSQLFIEESTDLISLYTKHPTSIPQTVRIGPYKTPDRLSDVSCELLAQDGSTLNVHGNHLIPYYPKELLHSHLRSFMRFSDSTQFTIPKQIKYANSDSSPFNSDESMSDEDISPQITTPSTNSNYDPTSSSSNDRSFIKLYDNSPYKEVITTLQTDISIDRSRHPSQNQSNSLPPLIDRTTKTHYYLRRQPKIDYRLFIPPSKL